MAGPVRLDRRIAATVVGITGAVVLVAAAGLWLSTRSLLLRNAERELMQHTERLRGAAMRPPPDGQPARPWWMRQPPPGPGGKAGRPRERRLMQVLDAATGRELARSPDLPEGVSLAPHGGGAEAGLPAMADPEGLGPVLVLSTRIGPGPGIDAPVLVWFAVELQPIHDELERLAWAMAALWTASVLLALGAVLVAVPATLRPLRTLTLAIDRLGPDDLSARVPAGCGPAEARALVGRLNQLLDRLEAAFRREQATNAGIAHELRTPVATLRAALEFRLLAPVAAEERGVLDRCLDTVLRMQEQVAALLLLARLEAGRESPQRSPCVPADLLAGIAERLEPRAAERGQRLAQAPGPSDAVETSPGHLELVLENLVGNALAHGPAGSVVALGVARQADGRVAVTVENPLDGPAPDPARLGEAWYRGDGARQASGHCGLGLALCRRLARLLGAELRLEAVGGRFTARLVLPG